VPMETLARSAISLMVAMCQSAGRSCHYNDSMATDSYFALAGRTPKKPFHDQSKCD
jgi:hypothetical protein